MYTAMQRVSTFGALAFSAGLLLVPSNAQAGTLYFQSNFESGVSIGTRINPTGGGDWAQDVFGQDNTLSSKDNWQTDLEHDQNPNVGVNGSYLSYVYINRIASASANAALVTDPVNSSNRVMRWQVFQPSEFNSDPELSKGRVQMEFSGPKNWREFHQEVLVRLPSATFNRVRSMPGTWGENKSWFFIGEFNHKNEITTDAGFTRPSRVYLQLRRENSGDPLRFQLAFQDQYPGGGYRGQWSRTSPLDVPLDEWFKLEFYIKEGGNANTGSAAGRVFVAMIRKNQQGQDVKTVLFNITGPTRAVVPNHASKGFSGYSGLKLYTNKPVIDWVNASGTNPVTMYWDNYKLWYGAYPWYMGSAAYEGGLSGTINVTWQG